MPVWLQFLTEKFSLWVVLFCGIFNILTATIFYSHSMVMAKNFYEFATELAIRERRPLVVRLLAMGESMLGKKWLRAWSIIQGLFFLAMAATGFVIL
jgi:hypothetical protein